MLIIVIFLPIILVLAAIDIKSFNTPNHKDFKLTILICGLLGSFLLVLAELDDFTNIANIIINASYIFVIAMCISIIINIYQKLKQVKMDSQNNINFIATKIAKCDNLDEIPNLSSINSQILQKLESIHNHLVESNNNQLKEISNLAQNNKDNCTRMLEALNKNNVKLIESLTNNYELLKEELLDSSNTIRKILIEELKTLDNSITKNFKNQMDISRVSNQKLES